MQQTTNQEPMLASDPQIGHWSGANEQFSIWVDDAAVTHCQRVSYWFGCERKYDRYVHIRYH